MPIDDKAAGAACDSGEIDHPLARCIVVADPCFSPGDGAQHVAIAGGQRERHRFIRFRQCIRRWIHHHGGAGGSLGQCDRLEITRAGDAAEVASVAGRAAHAVVHGERGSRGAAAAEGEHQVASAVFRNGCGRYREVHHIRGEHRDCARLHRAAGAAGRQLVAGQALTLPGASGGGIQKHTAIQHQLLFAIAVEVEPLDHGIGPHIRQRHRRGGQEALGGAAPLMHRHHQLAAQRAADRHAHLHQIQAVIAAHIHQPGAHLAELQQAVVEQASAAVHCALGLNRCLERRLAEEAAGIGDLEHLYPLAPGLLAIQAGHVHRLALFQLLRGCGTAGSAGLLRGGFATHQQ